MTILGENFEVKVLALYLQDGDDKYIGTNAMVLQRCWCIKYLCSTDGDRDIEVQDYVVQCAKSVKL